MTTVETKNNEIYGNKNEKQCYIKHQNLYQFLSCRWKFYFNTVFMMISHIYKCALYLCTDSKVKAWRQKRTLAKVLGGKGSHEPRRWEEDYKLVECEGLFEEYLEMGKYPLLYLKDM